MGSASSFPSDANGCPGTEPREICGTPTTVAPRPRDGHHHRRRCGLTLTFSVFVAASATLAASVHQQRLGRDVGSTIATLTLAHRPGYGFNTSTTIAMRVLAAATPE